MTPNQIGSTLESFLDEEGILEDVITDATLRVLAWQIRNDCETMDVSGTPGIVIPTKEES